MLYKYNYYLASGFFNESQTSTVTELETKLRGMNNIVYSPREHGVMLEKDSPIRNLLISEILDSNKKAINDSNKMVANIQGNDLGTLWEVGYWIGKRRDLSSLVVINDEYKVVDKFINELLGTEYPTNELDAWVVIQSENDYCALFTKDIPNVKYVITTDDRPPMSYLALGYLTGIGTPIEQIYTYSTQSYGSNIMIAGSIANHIRVDSVDKIDYGMLTYNSNKSSFNEIIE